jgi:nucleoside-diphosphate-sugar epimerase
MELAEKLLEVVKSYPEFKSTKTRIVKTTADEYYGKGYQDVGRRVPSIKKAKEILGWEPKTSFVSALKKTVEYYINEKSKAA